MPGYSGQVIGITPATNDDNWILDAAIDEYGDLVAASAGGEVTSGAVMSSQVTKSGSGTGSLTAGDVQQHQAHSAANLISFGTTYATTQPTLTAGCLIPLIFNANGGSLYIITDPNARPKMVGSEVTVCRNIVGTSQSSYGVVWYED